MSRSKVISARFDGESIVPATKDDLAFLVERYPRGTMLKVQVSQGRSTKHHNLYWGVLRAIVRMNGGEPWHNAEALDAAVKAQLGLFAPAIRLMDGSLRYELQSISFSSMDQAEFKVFFESAMLAIGDVTEIDMHRVVESVKANIDWRPDDEERMQGRSAHR